MAQSLVKSVHVGFGCASKDQSVVAADIRELILLGMGFEQIVGHGSRGQMCWASNGWVVCSGRLSHGSFSSCRLSCIIDC
jgi:hypothetical protein